MRPRDYATIAAVQFANVGVTGDGQEMGLAVGAAEDDAPHSALLNSYGIVDAHMMGIPALFIPWIRVNEQGRRFMNEEVPVSMQGAAIINQTHGRCWTVLDANYPQAAAQLKTAYLSMDPTIADGSVAVIGKMIEEGALIQADTVEELAEKMGVDAATLKETFERTTRDAAAGVDTLFEKEFLYPLDTPLFPRGIRSEGDTVSEPPNRLGRAMQHLRRLFAGRRIAPALKREGPVPINQRLSFPLGSRYH